MRISVSHKTHYRYERPVKALTQILRMTPRGDGGQHVRRWRIEPSVDGRLHPRQDSFGNIVHTFSADATVEAITMCVTGEVETHDAGGVVRGSVERLPDPVYLRDTDLTAPDEAIRAFAQDLGGDRPIVSRPCTGCSRRCTGRSPSTPRRPTSPPRRPRPSRSGAASART